MPPQAHVRYIWSPKQIALAVFLAAIAVVVTFDAWRDGLNIAINDEESSQIFLAPVVAAWLFWVRRHRWRLCRPTGTWIGPLFIAVGWFLYSFGDLHLIQFFWHAGAVVVAAGCILSVFGTDVLRNYFPALAVLGFLVPVPGLLRQQIALPLQEATALATHAILECLAVDVSRAGNVLIINGTEVAVAEACNGLRMVFSLTLVSYAFAFSTPLRVYVRVLMVAASPVLAILCNVIRLIPTVWLYGYHDLSVADSFHNISGWVMLPIAFLSLMAIVHTLRWALVPVTHYTLAYD